MRKSALFATALIVVLLGATAVLFTKYRRTAADYASVKESEARASARYEQTIDAIAEIQDSLNAILPPEGAVPGISSGMEAEQQLGGPSREQALDRIALLRAGIERNKVRIRQLEDDLHSRGLRIAGLEKMIAGLKRTALEKEQQILVLTGKVDSLQTRVTGLESEVAQGQETVRLREASLQETQHELTTIYYVIGPRKQLTASGLVVAKGGIFGIGSTLQPTGRFDESMFTPFDTNEQSVLPIAASRAQVLSAQPPSSYELKLVDGRLQLHILDPREFRSIRRLVIVTA